MAEAVHSVAVITKVIQKSIQSDERTAGFDNWRHKIELGIIGIHKGKSGRMLKYEIYKDDRHVFEDLAYRCIDNYSYGYKEEDSS